MSDNKNNQNKPKHLSLEEHNKYVAKANTMENGMAKLEAYYKKHNLIPPEQPVAAPTPATTEQPVPTPTPAVTEQPVAAPTPIATEQPEATTEKPTIPSSGVWMADQTQPTLGEAPKGSVRAYFGNRRPTREELLRAVEEGHVTFVESPEFWWNVTGEEVPNSLTNRRGSRVDQIKRASEEKRKLENWQKYLINKEVRDFEGLKPWQKTEAIENLFLDAQRFLYSSRGVTMTQGDSGPVDKEVVAIVNSYLNSLNVNANIGVNDQGKFEVWSRAYERAPGGSFVLDDEGNKKLMLIRKEITWWDEFQRATSRSLREIAGTTGAGAALGVGLSKVSNAFPDPRVKALAGAGALVTESLVAGTTKKFDTEALGLPEDIYTAFVNNTILPEDVAKNLALLNKGKDAKVRQQAIFDAQEDYMSSNRLKSSYIGGTEETVMGAGIGLGFGYLFRGLGHAYNVLTDDVNRAVRLFENNPRYKSYFDEYRKEAKFTLFGKKEDLTRAQQKEVNQLALLLTVQDDTFISTTEQIIKNSPHKWTDLNDKVRAVTNNFSDLSNMNSLVKLYEQTQGELEILQLGTSVLRKELVKKHKLIKFSESVEDIKEAIFKSASVNEENLYDKYSKEGSASSNSIMSRFMGGVKKDIDNKQKFKAEDIDYDGTVKEGAKGDLETAYLFNLLESAKIERSKLNQELKSAGIKSQETKTALEDMDTFINNLRTVLDENFTKDDLDEEVKSIYKEYKKHDEAVKFLEESMDSDSLAAIIKQGKLDLTKHDAKGLLDIFSATNSGDMVLGYNQLRNVLEKTNEGVENVALLELSVLDDIIAKSTETRTIEGKRTELINFKNVYNQLTDFKSKVESLGKNELGFRTAEAQRMYQLMGLLGNLSPKLEGIPKAPQPANIAILAQNFYNWIKIRTVATLAKTLMRKWQTFKGDDYYLVKAAIDAAIELDISPANVRIRNAFNESIKNLDNLTDKKVISELQKGFEALQTQQLSESSSLAPGQGANAPGPSLQPVVQGANPNNSEAERVVSQALNQQAQNSAPNKPKTPDKPVEVITDEEEIKRTLASFEGQNPDEAIEQQNAMFNNSSKPTQQSTQQSEELPIPQSEEPPIPQSEELPIPQSEEPPIPQSEEPPIPAQTNVQNDEIANAGREGTERMARKAEEETGQRVTSFSSVNQDEVDEILSTLPPTLADRAYEELDKRVDAMPNITDDEIDQLERKILVKYYDRFKNSPYFDNPDANEFYELSMKKARGEISTEENKRLEEIKANAKKPKSKPKAESIVPTDVPITADEAVSREVKKATAKKATAKKATAKKASAKKSRAKKASAKPIGDEEKFKTKTDFAVRIAGSVEKLNKLKALADLNTTREDLAFRDPGAGAASNSTNAEYTKSEFGLTKFYPNDQLGPDFKNDGLINLVGEDGSRMTPEEESAILADVFGDIGIQVKNNTTLKQLILRTLKPGSSVSHAKIWDNSALQVWLKTAAKGIRTPEGVFLFKPLTQAQVERNRVFFEDIRQQIQE